MQNVIEVSNLSKSFGEKMVVESISFAVNKGSLFAFLGQNGAGKTTTINMIIGLIRQNGGTILYNGQPNFLDYKNKIGVVFQNNILEDLLTVEENLLTYGRLYIPSAKKVKARFDEIVELLSLGGVVKQRFKTLSGGQRRKAEIARALFMSPEILFLDEPTTGLDPKTRADVWEIMHRLKNENGLTIFLTTHYMEETALADNVAIIDQGKIIATGSPTELKSAYAYDKLLITPNDAALLEYKLQALSVPWQKTADVYTLRIDNTQASISLLYNLKEDIRFYEVIKGTMDDVFLAAVGKKVNERGDAAV